MDGYLLVCLTIVLASIVSGFITGYKNKNTIKEIIFYAGVYYYAVSAVRMLQGHADELLGHAMKGKNIAGYAKMLVFITASWITIYLIRRIRKEIINSIIYNTVWIFWMIQIMTVICYDMPTLKLTVTEGVASALVAIILSFLKHKEETATEKRTDVMPALIAVLAWIVMHAITAPTEIYAYNSEDFVYRYKDLIPSVLLFVLGMTVTAYLLIRYGFSVRQNRILTVITFSYTLLAYIQTMFLNGKMNVMEGITQSWSTGRICINAAIWITVILIIVVFALKKSVFFKVCTYASALLIILQLLGLSSLLISGNLFHEDKVQLTQDKAFELGSDKNVVVFILDTYDVQMINMVEEKDPNFLSPLNDFTLYDNMVSRFGYTDGSLPYLLTGILVDEYSKKEYDESTFLKDMKSEGIDIRLITEEQYVRSFDEGLVDNRSYDWDVTMETGKTAGQMLNCSRYRGVPFILKDKYVYTEQDLATCIDHADFYLFGNDQVFYEDMISAGVTVSDEYKNAFRLYHIYGAHSPYNFREDMTYDYSEQKPVEQWRASLKIVYSYLDDMKKSGCYDDSTIIIMADHGPNIKQRAALSTLGISFSDELRPIFFIKRANEEHESYIRDHRETSHDVFCATVMRSYDDLCDTYGLPVWER
ncbi:MAG: hypothetical protein IKQ44_05125 [Lachnospiraceae bacterium]|nr:hypothetical protein [Lachnospiraceae bacterium]